MRGPYVKLGMEWLGLGCVWGFLLSVWFALGFVGVGVFFLERCFVVVVFGQGVGVVFSFNHNHISYLCHF